MTWVNIKSYVQYLLCAGLRLLMVYMQMVQEEYYMYIS